MFVEIKNNIYNVINIQSLAKSQDSSKYYITYIIKNGSSITEEFDTESSRNTKYDEVAAAGGSGGGGATRDWSKVGYEETPTTLNDGYDYAKQIYDNWDASVTNRDSQYNSDFKLVVFPNVNFSNVTNAVSCFLGCTSLTTIPNDLLNYNKEVSCTYMFSSCYALTEIGDIKVSGTKSSMFYNCKSLKKVNSINIANTTDNNIFNGCKNLEEINNITAGTNGFSIRNNNMFTDCPKLSNNTLKVILKFFKQLQYQGWKNLANFGLSQTQAELCTTFDEWQDLANAGWTTGY